MTEQPRTTKILGILADVDHATTDSLSTQITCLRAELIKTISNMRVCGTIETEDGKHRITLKGREELLLGPPTKSVIHKPFRVPNARAQSEYLRAVPSGTSDHRAVIHRPTWTPPAWTPARPGADDHKAYGSRGIV